MGNNDFSLLEALFLRMLRISRWCEIMYSYSLPRNRSAHGALTYVGR